MYGRYGFRDTRGVMRRTRLFDRYRGYRVLLSRNIVNPGLYDEPVTRDEPNTPIKVRLVSVAINLINDGFDSRRALV